MKLRWAARALTTGAVLVVGTLAPDLARAGATAKAPTASPQNGSGGAVPRTVAIDSCQLFQQQNSTGQRYRKTSNAFRSYDNLTVGKAYFSIDCGSVVFTVPRGKDALVDLSAVAELDCQGAATANSWCEGRFLVDGLPVPSPDNTGRSDTYAWDSGNGGKYDWQANALDQEYSAHCAKESGAKKPCVYQVTLQSRLDNGASGLWVDDLTVRVDVTEGPVTVRDAAP